MLAQFWLPPPLVLTVVLVSGATTAWQGQVDNKSVGLLSRLGPVGIVSEGRAVCVAGAAATAPEAHHTAEEAKTYLRTLGRVAQLQEPDNPPTWAPRMLDAVARQDTLACNAIWSQEVQTYLAALLYKATKRLGPAFPTDPL